MTAKQQENPVITAWRWDLSALRHPIWWAALALMIVNDRWLKGHGVAPAYLTGKLSDFAFLIVAPVVFAALLPRALPGRRVLALLAVTGIYVACDLSPEFSHAVQLAAAQVGLRWVLWPDFSDLLALLVLPLTYWLLRERPRATRRWHVLPERAGLAFGALACLATSAPSQYPHQPFLVNRAGKELEVRVSWVLRKVDCTALPSELAQTLTPSDLDAAISFKLPKGEIAALDGPPSDGSSPVGRCGIQPSVSVTQSPQPACIAAILETDTAQPVLMVAHARWFKSIEGPFFSCERRPPPVSPCQSPWPQKLDPGPDAVELSTKDGAPEFRGARVEPGVAVGDVPVRIAELDLAALRARTPAADGCREMLDEYTELRTEQGCTSDADCQAVGAVPFPNEPLQCNTFLNAAAAERIKELALTWSADCGLAVARTCPMQGPGRCEAGSCAPLCPDGLRQKTCPSTCDEVQSSFDTFCALGGECRKANGVLCSCVANALMCADAPPQAAPCEMPCGPVTPPRDEDSGAAGSRP